MAVVGTGRIGIVHANLIAAGDETTLAGVASLDDPPTVASTLGVPHCADYRDLIDLDLDGVVIAAPNHLHLEMGRFFAEHGIHLLVEKPIADTLEHGRALCDAASGCGVKLLVGQHRRYNNLVREAGRMVATQIGRLMATNTMLTVRKPDSYYEVTWQRSESAGPLLVNLIHEVDILRTVCGEIDRVQASGAKLARTFDFDDTAVILLEYRNGALGTMVVSESTPSPWSWEASVDDGLGFHHSGADYSKFLGSEAALSFPSLTRWSYDNADGEPGWHLPLQATPTQVERNNPYADQISHFARVIRGLEEPIVPGEDALRSLAVVVAVLRAIRTAAAVEVADLV